MARTGKAKKTETKRGQTAHFFQKEGPIEVHVTKMVKFKYDGWLKNKDGKPTIDIKCDMNALGLLGTVGAKSVCIADLITAQKKDGKFIVEVTTNDIEEFYFGEPLNGPL